jgi:hypothetical protein
MSWYAEGETVERDLGRLFPAFFRRLMFSTSEFFFLASFFAAAIAPPS